MEPQRQEKRMKTRIMLEAQYAIPKWFDLPLPMIHGDSNNCANGIQIQTQTSITSPMPKVSHLRHEPSVFARKNLERETQSADSNKSIYAMKLSLNRHDASQPHKRQHTASSEKSSVVVKKGKNLPSLDITVSKYGLWPFAKSIAHPELQTKLQSDATRYDVINNELSSERIPSRCHNLEGDLSGEMAGTLQAPPEYGGYFGAIRGYKPVYFILK